MSAATTNETQENVLTAVIRSSYKNPVDYGDVLGAIVTAKRPLKRIAEYGILDGFSLDVFVRLSPDDCVIEARDIFENFDGNGARRSQLEARFANRLNNIKVSILEGDFHDASKDLDNGCYDLIHVDIANNGDIYAEAEQTLFSKLAVGGLLILEGGTPARDQVPWMLQYGKSPIVPEIDRLKALGKYDVTVLGTFPGITIMRKKDIIPKNKIPDRVNRAFF